MLNGKKVASVAFTGAATTAATMMGAGHALAAPQSWHFKTGGLAYSGIVKAKNLAGTSPSFKDTTTGAVLRCKKAVASGVISHKWTPGPQVGYLKKSVTKWSSCTAGFFKFRAHLATSPTVSASAFNAVTGVTSGNLFRSKNNTTFGKISVVISGTSGNTCHATISGTSVPLTYSNSPTHSFNVNSARTATLKVKIVTGACFGQLNANDNAYFHGIYHVSTPAALNIWFS